MRRSKALTTVASLFLVLGVASCSGDQGESKEDLVEDVSATLRTGGDNLDQQAADCVAEVVVDDIGVDQLQDVDLDDPPEELEDDIAAATIRATDECELGGDG